MPLAAAIPLVIILLILGIAGSSISGTTNDSNSVVMSRQGMFSGIAPSEAPTGATSVSINGFDNGGGNGSVPEQPIVVTTTPTPTVTVTTLDTLSPQDITAYSTTMRGTVEVPAGSRVFFVSSNSQAALRRAVQSTSYETLVSLRLSDVSIQPVSLYTGTPQSVRQYLSALTPDTTYYYQLCVDVATGTIRCADVVNFSTSAVRNQSSYFYAPTVSLSYPSDIRAEQATISGTYQVNSGEDLDIFLVYGTNQTLVNAVSTNSDTFSDVRESGAALQTVRVGARINSNGSFTRTIDDLDNDTPYYYAVCAEYTGEKDGLTCSYGYSFTTKDRDRAVPSLALQALAAPRIVAFTSTVDMNDYRNGHAFIVYGTNESYVAAVADSWSFASVYQRGDELQVISLDTDVDSREVFTRTVRDMTVPTLYFARTCVEYSQEDQYGYERIVVDCGRAVPFTVQ